MNNRVLGCVIAVAVSQAAGCIITTGDDTDTTHHSITVSWALETAATGLSASCPAGYDTAALFSQEVDMTGASVGDPPTIDLFNCAAGVGLSSRLPSGFYDEWVELTNTDNTMQFAKSRSSTDEHKQLDLTMDLAYQTEIIVDGGYFHVAWNLVGADSGAALTCAEANASGGIELSAMPTSGAAVMKVFPCTDQQGLTAGIASGTYTISVDAFDSSNQTLGTAPMLIGQTIDEPSTLQPVTDLGTVTIPITGM